jgi:hypothetical protein
MAFFSPAGPDQYDANWCGRPAAYNEMDGEQPIGIGAWVDWVIRQGVPFAVPEWGVDSGQWGSGDRPQFIDSLLGRKPRPSGRGGSPAVLILDKALAIRVLCRSCA